jgi:hypothetical protein
MKIRVFKGRDQIYFTSIEAQIGMVTKQGRIKRITAKNVWVESSVPRYAESGYPVAQPTMNFAQAQPYLKKQ